MKKVMMLVAMVIMMVAVDASAQQRGPGQRGRMLEQNAQQQIERMVKKLDLSKQQADQLEHLYDERAKQMESARKQCKGDREAMRRQMEQTNLAFENRMKGILSPEQYKDYEKWMKAEKRHAPAYGQRGAGRPGMRGDGEKWERGPKCASQVVVVCCCKHHNGRKAKKCK